MTRRSTAATGHAGEYGVMCELLRRGFDALLADRNQPDYDIVAGRQGQQMRRIQVKCNRDAHTWYIKTPSYEGHMLDEITVFVILGKDPDKHPIRYFVTKNADVAPHIHRPKSWDKGKTKTAFMSLKSILEYEGRWDLI